MLDRHQFWFTAFKRMLVGRIICIYYKSISKCLVFRPCISKYEKTCVFIKLPLLLPVDPLLEPPKLALLFPVLPPVLPPPHWLQLFLQFVNMYPALLVHSPLAAHVTQLGHVSLHDAIGIITICKLNPILKIVKYTMSLVKIWYRHQVCFTIHTMDVR